MRTILANLLAEDDLERLVHTGHPRYRPPSAGLLRTVSPLAAKLAVFGRPGDRLWLPGDPPPEPAAEVLAWCETPEAAALRATVRPALHPPDLQLPLAEFLWRLPVAAPEVVARVHHRAFALRAAEELGCALPAARMVESLAELDRILAARDAPDAWVVKAPFSAAGRARYIERNGPRLADPKSRRTVENLFDRHGSLLFEPWLDRIADWGCSALLTETDLRIVGIHRQRVDVKGQFAGIELETADLPAEDRSRLEEVVTDVAALLRGSGYAGPFGIDAWHWRRPDGTVAFHPLGEINARMTFGLVEWAADSDSSL